MSDPAKPEGADPDIPDEVKKKILKPHRPAGFAPKNPGAEEDNPPEEKEQTGPVRDLTAFFAKLAHAVKTGTFYRLETVQKDVRRRVEGSRAFEWVRETREIKIPVLLKLGEDGMPFPVEPVAAAEAKRVKALSYPDAPPQDPKLGDLTPDFSEWLYLTHPYDAAVRYSARNSHVQVAALDRVRA